MEAIYEFEVKDMPVTVAVDSTRRVRACRRAADLGRENQGIEDSGARRLRALFRYPYAK